MIRFLSVFDIKLFTFPFFKVTVSSIRIPYSPALYTPGSSENTIPSCKIFSLLGLIAGFSCTFNPMPCPSEWVNKSPYPFSYKYSLAIASAALPVIPERIFSFASSCAVKTQA